MRKVHIAAIAVAGLLLVPSAASAQLCVLGIIGKAIYASSHDKRELTQTEAMTCGLFEKDPLAPAAEAKPKKKVRAAKKKE